MGRVLAFHQKRLLHFAIASVKFVLRTNEIRPRRMKSGLWPDEIAPLGIGDPGKAQRSGFAGEQTSNEMSEFSRFLENE